MGQTYTQKDNSGTLFRNDNRATENHPHAKGKALIGGRWYWVSAWTKEGPNDKYQSLSFQEMTEEQTAKYASGNGGQNPPPARPASPTRPAPARPTSMKPAQRPVEQPYGDEQVINPADCPF